MSSFLGGVIGGRIFDPGYEEQEPGFVGMVGSNQASPARVKAARGFWPEFSAGDVSRHGRYFAGRDGSLYLAVPGDPLLAERPSEMTVAAFVVTGTTILYLQRPERAPFTLAELDESRAAADLEHSEHAEQRAAFVAQQPQLPILLTHLMRRDLPTLRGAAEVIEAHGGRISLDDRGDLLITWPERLFEPARDIGGVLDTGARETMIAAARVLVAAKAVVVDELQRSRGKSVAARLPDRHLTASGGLA